MQKLRLVARLDIKNQYVIKGIHLEGLRKIGDPVELAESYFKQGIDEIIFMDAVASLYGRNNLFHIIESACKKVFIPITIGGGIRELVDIENALRSGADKISLNTQAIRNPTFVKEASRIYGSQCIVGSIEAKRKAFDKWEAYVYNGREETGIDVIEWAKELEQLGAGELLVTSVDQEGTRKGFDIELVQKVSQSVSIPIIASGGGGNVNHISSVVQKSQVRAIAVASLIHYNSLSIPDIKRDLNLSGIPVRI